MFSPGKIWNDTNGKAIESHVGGVLYEQGVYYWYGMNWDVSAIPPDTLPKQAYSWFLNRGITVYSSRDLVHWKHESTVLADVSFKSGDLLQPLNGLIRPKVIRNDRTGKYVLMAVLTAPDFNSYNDIVVAVADSPTGPFTLQGKLGWSGTPNQTGLWNHAWGHAGDDAATRIRGFDMGLYKDDDGKAYLITAHTDMWMYELSDDYLSVRRVAAMEGAEGEAPAVFKSEGTYYLVTSRLSGWAPNRNTYFTAPTIQGPWRARGAFAQGPREETTFDSQVTFVLPVAGRKGAFVFMADWFHAASDREVPDFRQATHVWLPIELDGRTQTMRVRWREAWDLSVFDTV